MRNTNAAIYGPPSHTPNTFTVYVAKDDEGDWRVDILAHAATAKGVLWKIYDAAVVPQQEYQHLVVGQVLEQLMGDMVRDLPGTEARARFVQSGGLYEQTTLW